MVLGLSIAILNPWSNVKAEDGMESREQKRVGENDLRLPEGGDVFARHGYRGDFNE
jgi:hypothetical protein